MSKRICIINDNDRSNINGVVTTFTETIKELEKRGYSVLWVSPSDFKSVPCPTYPEVRLSLSLWNLKSKIDSFNPDYIHIATEGPLGYMAMRYCEKNNYKFTTSFHTKTPEYIKEKIKIFPLELGYAALRRLHKNSSDILVTTQSMKEELLQRNFNPRITIWGRGVDTEIFTPERRVKNTKITLLYVGRISKEKNIEEFLNLDFPDYELRVVGDGPQRKAYEEKYKDKQNIKFLGYRRGMELATEYASTDVFVFPSYTDTYGIVMLEALACGTPVVAHDVTGPKDCIDHGVTGYLTNNLHDGILDALNLDREIVSMAGQRNTWANCTDVFESSLITKD